MKVALPKVNHASATPSASDSEVVVRSLGQASAPTLPSMSAIASRPSAVWMFHVMLMRSRQ